MYLAENDEGTHRISISGKPLKDFSESTFLADSNNTCFLVRNGAQIYFFIRTRAGDFFLLAFVCYTANQPRIHHTCFRPTY